ncbi:hypothetical protein CHS0354_043039 [Potamilus streckersoni]|uniref:PSI domain-containing protein n=1 Tax=Potamilus streckersoni TaxID=2493646 RepID=A0AAE0SCY4_9BIVA|nr:hypothetical protein CHS0354_043039 [Potamilus streckersoni]
MEAIQFAVVNLLFLISISIEIHGIHISAKDLRYSSLRDQDVIILDSSERYRRQAPIVLSPVPSQNTSQKEATTVMATNTTINDVNRTTSVLLPTTGTPPTVVINDTHEYYTSIIMQSQADNYWVELSNATLHQELRNTSMKAQTIQFQTSSFLFYGHQIYNVTITTGGFLYMSPFVHTFLTATQYTAPLMADFGTMGNNSDIYFQEYANQFIVEWRNVYLVSQKELGPFKFQTILYKNGSIAFIYQKVPVAISSISTANHPVKIGLADAFYIDAKNARGQIIRTIYSYHTIKINLTNVKPKTVIIFHPLTTCNLAKDCYTCVNQKNAFKCLWCAKVQRCSDSLDWNRQEWLESGCNVEGHNSSDRCSETSNPSPIATTTKPSTTETPGPNNYTLSTKTQSTFTPSTTITPVPTSSTTGLATNQTTSIKSPNPTPRELTTPKTTTLRELPTAINTTQTTTLANETSQMPITNSTINSATITTTLKPNITAYQTTKTTLPSPTPQKITIETIPPTTTLMKFTTNITTSQTATLRQETSQTLTSNTTTTSVAPCNKNKDGICGQGSQPSTQNQVSLASGSSNAPMIAMVVVLVLIALGTLIGFLVYAYRNPTSAPGQWLIKNRPSALRERVKNVRDNFFKSLSSDSSEKYRLETESEL